MNSKVNLIISFAEMLQKIANETKDTEYTQTFNTAMEALSSEDGGKPSLMWLTPFITATPISLCPHPCLNT